MDQFTTLECRLKEFQQFLTDWVMHIYTVRVCFQLFHMPEYQNSKRVCLYLSMAEEVNTTVVLQHALQSKRECFIPQYIGKIFKHRCFTPHSLSQNKGKIYMRRCREWGGGS